MEIPSKFIYAEKKPDMQKQLGCMNGIFQLFDRRHLHGRRATDQNLKKLHSGPNANQGMKLGNVADKTPAQPTNLKDLTTTRGPVESSRTSISSCSSSIFSSVDCKTTITASSLSQSISPDTPKPIVPTKQPNAGSPFLDFRDVVKGSMYREARGVSVKTVTKHQGKDHVMKHIDSPRPAIRWNSKDEKRSSFPLSAPRFSYDERDSRHKLKSSVKLKELPRLSLDSRVRSIKSSASESRGQNGNSSEMMSTNQEPGSNKRQSSVVAKLMGLEALPDTPFSDEVESRSQVNPRLTRIGDDSKENQHLGSPMVPINNPDLPRFRKSSSAMRPTSSSRFPLEPAPWSQLKNIEQPTKTKNGPPSVYGEIEKRLTELEFKKSGKDLRALKQILEAMQKTRARMDPRKEEEISTSESEKSQCSPNSKLSTRQSLQSNNAISPSIKGIRSPKRYGSAIVIMKPAKVTQKSSDYSDATPRSNHLRDPSSGSPTYMDKKTKARTARSSTGPQHMGEKPDGLRRISGTVSPRQQQKKHEQSHLTNASLDLTRAKMQPCKQPIDTTRKPKAKPKSTTSQVKTEVTNLDHTTAINNFAVRLSEESSMAELAVTNIEQPSPISVLDPMFYGEGSPSPVKKISYAFKDYETPDCNDTELNTMDIDDLQSRARTNLNSKFNASKLGDFTNSVHKLRLNSSSEDITPLESTTPDRRYITEILLASGLLADLGTTITSMQIHPSSHFVNPDLFHILENINGNNEFSNEKRHEKNGRSKYNAKLQRKLVFDTVNEILVQTLVSPISSKLRIFHNRLIGRVPRAEEVMREVFSEIDHLNAHRGCSVEDVDEELTDILSADMMNRSDDWGTHHGEVPGLVLDIERMIFKDLVSEIVSGGPVVII